jgi:predicted SAM-dependent methyltransferase
MKLNLGSGGTGKEAIRVIDRFNVDDWKSVDICAEFKPDECYDITEGIREETGSVERIWMGDFIEHVAWPKVTYVIAECFRVLQSGGVLLISTPDMARVMPKWLENPTPDLSCLIHGQQGETVGHNEWPDAHKSGFTERSLSKLLTTAGFVHVERIEIHPVWYDLGMRAVKP